MKVLVIGSGGREHAIAWKLSQSPQVEQLFAYPGNPGIAQVAECVGLTGVTPEAYLRVAEGVEADLTVVGPEAPLVAGIVDAFRAAGRKIIGPTSAAAQLEGSKVFAKEFMKRTGVPTARAVTVDSPQAAPAAFDEIGFPLVLKADGLAGGKGVIIAPDRETAESALRKLPPGRLVIEEFLEGEEVSYIVLADGMNARPLAATQDHKAVNDGDTGPNTGGMGAYCDGRIITEAESDQILTRIIEPTLIGMAEAGTPFTGFLYAGLMMTASGPKVLEFNVRLGDPETQVLMHRMESDFAAVLADGAPLTWKPDPSVCVVLAAYGYPGEVRTGDRIEGLEDCPATVFHSGTRTTTSAIETSGGRVLGVTDSGPDLPAAIHKTYSAMGPIHFAGMHFRTDIGRKGLKRW